MPLSCWISLTFFLWNLAFSHCHSHCHWVAAYLLLSPIVSCCFSLSLLSHGVTACLSLSLLVAGCLSMSLQYHRFCCMSLTLSYGCCLSLTLSFVLRSCYMSLTDYFSSMEFLQVHRCLPWFLAISHILSQWPWVAAFLSQSFMIPGCLSLSLRSHGVATCLSLFLLLPLSCCMCLTVSYGCWVSINLSPIPLSF